MQQVDKINVSKCNTIQTYLNSLEQDNDSTTVIVNGSGEEADEDVTYFVDEQGRYYYQHNGDNKNLVSLHTEEDPENGEIAQESQSAHLQDYQTVTLDAAAASGIFSYVLIVQDEHTEPATDADIKTNADHERNNPVYNFDDEKAGTISEDVSDDPESHEQLSKPTTATKQTKSVRSAFECGLCSYASHRRYLLKRHMRIHTQERPHKCSVCERGFKTVQSLHNHVNMHNGVKPHVCNYCKNSFTTSGELVRHVRYKHTHYKPHKCTECDYASVEMSKLRRHIRCHTGERPYQCPHCTYASQDTFKLKRHLRIHTGEKPYKCDQCNMCFTQSNSLKAHKLIHNVDDRQEFPCLLCPSKFSRKSDLRTHMYKLHTSDKPLHCKRCHKSLADQYSLKLHSKTHTGEKCYKCELCSYKSIEQRHLKSHMLTHSDEKPYSCDQCSQSFRQKQLLQRHQNLYHNLDYFPKPPKKKTHTCHECKRTFAHKGNLIRHLAVHDPDSGERALTLNLEEFGEETDEVVKLDLGGDQQEHRKLLTVADSDGQQYVVLEVIQLEDSEDLQHISASDYTQENEGVEEVNIHQLEDCQLLQPKAMDNLKNDIDTCFGFNHIEDLDDNEEHISYTYDD